ncbi:MAG: phosphoribosylamine--glycine ligase [Dehalococcoidales bacterium]
MLKVLVIGNGAREHTLVWKLSQSPRVEAIYAAPGNAGTDQIACNLEISPTDIEGLLTAVADYEIDLTVVGPEAPLAAGIVDRFQGLGLAVFGATRGAAQIESSKVFSKELMQKYGLPCAQSASFSDYDEAKRYLRQHRLPVVIKADGLAAGKGVVVAESQAEALAALADFMERKTLGGAGDRVLIEEHLAGREMSVFAFTDARTVAPVVTACDYKRIYDGDRGPNTGGMGSYSPPHFLTPELNESVTEQIMKPAVSALGSENYPYQGILYGGLMINNSAPKVLEFNARFGDPETQVVLPRLKTDLVDIMMAIVRGKLDEIEIEWSEEACVGVVMASAGYPGSYKTGFTIRGLDQLEPDIMVFHAGTKPGDTPGEVVTSGGRVLTVAAGGENIKEARDKVYRNISRISFEGSYYRQDIALF